MRNLASFSNRFVEAVCEEGRTNVLFDHFGKALSLNKEESLVLLAACLEEVKKSGKTYRQCLLSYKISGKIRRMENLLSGSIRSRRREDADCARIPPVPKDTEQAHPDQVKQFFNRINQALKERAPFKEFAPIVLDALRKGIGLDRVLIVSLVAEPDKMYLQGRLGAGDILPGEIGAFRYPLVDFGDVLSECLACRRDMSFVVGEQTSMPPRLKKLFLGRFLCLRLLYVNDTLVGLLLLDRKPGRLPLTETQLHAVNSLRDLLLLGIRNDMQGFM